MQLAHAFSPADQRGQTTIPHPRTDRFGLPVLISAVLAVILLFTACSGSKDGTKTAASDPSTVSPSKKKDGTRTQSVIVALSVDFGAGYVTLPQDNKVEAAKGSSWGSVKTSIIKNLIFEDGYEAGSWMLLSGQNADAKPLDDSYILNGGKTGTESVRFSVYKKPLSPPSAPAAGSKTVTVSFICTAQEGIITPGCESLTVEKGAPWKNIKPYAESICTPKPYRNIEKWQSGTTDIPDDYLITENTVLTAVLRDNRISLRFSVYTSGSNSPHLKIKTDHLTVQNGTAWKHIKDKILAGINPIEGYENYGLDKITPGSADAKPITDDFVFKRDESNEYNLYIHEKKTKHILTIEYDSGISGAEPGVIYADINAK